MRPIAARAMVERKMHTRWSGHTGFTRHSPRNGFNGFLRDLLGDRLSCHRRFAENSTKLDASTGASGPHDFSVRKLSALVFSAASRPPHSVPRP